MLRLLPNVAPEVQSTSKVQEPTHVKEADASCVQRSTRCAAAYVGVWALSRVLKDARRRNSKAELRPLLKHMQLPRKQLLPEDDVIQRPPMSWLASSLEQGDVLHSAC